MLIFVHPNLEYYSYEDYTLTVGRCINNGQIDATRYFLESKILHQQYAFIFNFFCILLSKVFKTCPIFMIRIKHLIQHPTLYSLN